MPPNVVINIINLIAIEAFVQVQANKKWSRLPLCCFLLFLSLLFHFPLSLAVCFIGCCLPCSAALPGPSLVHYNWIVIADSHNINKQAFMKMTSENIALHNYSFPAVSARIEISSRIFICEVFRGFCFDSRITSFSLMLWGNRKMGSSGIPKSSNLLRELIIRHNCFNRKSDGEVEADDHLLRL